MTNISFSKNPNLLFDISFTISIFRARFFYRGYSSVGRAPALQAGGQEFEPPYLHHFTFRSVLKNLSSLSANFLRKNQGALPCQF